MVPARRATRLKTAEAYQRPDAELIDQGGDELLVVKGLREAR